jgi:hypothetical protein
VAGVSARVAVETTGVSAPATVPADAAFLPAEMPAVASGSGARAAGAFAPEATAATGRGAIARAAADVAAAAAEPTADVTCPLLVAGAAVRAETALATAEPIDAAAGVPDGEPVTAATAGVAADVTADVADGAGLMRPGEVECGAGTAVAGAADLAWDVADVTWDMAEVATWANGAVGDLVADVGEVAALACRENTSSTTRMPAATIANCIAR